MNLKEIILANEKHNFKIQELEDAIEHKNDIIEILNKEINYEEFRELTYLNAKEIYEMLKYNMPIGDRSNLKTILDEIKRSEYPILNGAYKYPILNDMDFISNEQKVMLDDHLNYIHKGYLYTSCGAWYSMEVNHEQTDKILDFLIQNKILEKAYVIYCDCGDKCSPDLFSQEVYDEFIAYHNGEFDELKITEDGIEDDVIWKKGYMEVGCWNDGHMEIDNKEEFLESVQVHGYKVIGVPDRSLDEI